MLSQKENKKISSFWIHKKKYEDLCEIAKKKDITVSALLRLIIYDWIAKNKSKEMKKVS